MGIFCDWNRAAMLLTCAGSLVLSNVSFASDSGYCSSRYADVLSLAVCEQDLSKVRILVEEQGRDVNAPDAAGMTPMAVAFHSGSVYWMPVEEGMGPIISYLLDQGADPNKPTSLESGSTALHEAAYTGNMTLVPLLLKHGANVNARNNYGLTPSHEAAFCDFRLSCDDCSTAGAWRAGAKPTLQFLLSKGADFQAKDKDQRTVLDEFATPCADHPELCDPAKIDTAQWPSGTCKESYLFVKKAVEGKH